MKNSLWYKNLINKPGRTLGLVLLTALLSFSIFIGTSITGALRGGLSSLENRLGADIMVVPYEATTKANLQNIVLQGATGYFYMDDKVLDQISAMEGVGQISPQLFLASVSSGCCSIPVQIIGYDPDTDFTITPWIKTSNQEALAPMEIIVGNDLNAFVGDTLTFYNQEVRVTGKLDRTGTGLDTAVYCNEDTIKALIQSSLDMDMNTFKDVDPEKVVSCILIKVDESHTIEDVLNDINIHVKGIKAIKTQEMISGVSESLRGTSGIIRILMAAIWVLAMAILAIVFAVSLRERKKEFAVLRSVGASRKNVASMVLSEGMAIGAIGSILGVLIGLLVIVPFNRAIESSLGLPFLLPGPGKMLGTALLALLTAVIAIGLVSYILSKRISRL